MKKMLLILLTVCLMLAVAACGKKTTSEPDPNAVLTDSNVPLEVGAELWEFGTEVEEGMSVQMIPAT